MLYCAVLSFAEPALFNQLSHAPRLVRRRATVRCAASSASAPEPQFLVRNERNDVHIIQCPTAGVLKQAMLELGGLPHICVAGESNAGKSSLINHLLKKQLARASSVAGKTRSVDMLEVNKRLVLTDLPGLPSRDHQVARMWQTSWQPLVMHYIRQCEPLRAMLYVHDVRWKVSPLVREFVHEVQNCGVPVLLVLTKDDHLREEAKIAGVLENEQRMKYTRGIRRALEFDGLHEHYTCESSLPAGRRGRRQLLRQIEQLVACDSRFAAAQMLENSAAKKQGRDARRVG